MLPVSPGSGGGGLKSLAVWCASYWKEPPSVLHGFSFLTPSKHGETKVLPANSSSGTDQAGFLKWADEVWYRMCSESLGEEELNAKVAEFLHLQFSQLGLFFLLLWVVRHRWDVVWLWGSLHRFWSWMSGFQTLLVIPVQGGELLNFPT